MSERRVQSVRVPLRARLRAVPSKSVTHRALLAAALADSTSTLLGPLDADDTRATADGLAALGIEVSRHAGAWEVRPQAGRVPGGASIFLDASGTSLRFLIALAALGERPSRFDAAPRLRERPTQELAHALIRLGARVAPGVAPGWWTAAVLAGRECLAGQDTSRIAAIGLSSQREGVVPIGRDGLPLSRCIIWMDRRCRPQSARLGEEFGEAFLHRHTGVAPDPKYTACKLLWLRENEPDLLARTALFLQPRDFLYYRLTGEPATDHTLASRTMMIELRKVRWWPDMFARVGIRPEQFPPVYRSAEAPHRVAATAAEALGIPVGVPVALGGGDRSCDGVGAGLAGHRVSDSTGTATQISMVTERLPDDLGRVPL